MAASVLHAQVAADYDFGPPPADPIEAAKLLMPEVLKDPASATYQFSNTFKGRCKRGRLGGAQWIGWAANVSINAKNSFGGYTGYQPYTILFSGGIAVRAIEGANFGAYGPAKGMFGLSGRAGVCQIIRDAP